MGRPYIPIFFVLVDTNTRIMRFKVNAEDQSKAVVKLHKRLGHRQPDKQQYNVSNKRPLCY